MMAMLSDSEDDDDSRPSRKFLTLDVRNVVASNLSPMERALYDQYVCKPWLEYHTHFLDDVYEFFGLVVMINGHKERGARIRADTIAAIESAAALTAESVPGARREKWLLLDVRNVDVASLSPMERAVYQQYRKKSWVDFDAFLEAFEEFFELPVVIIGRELFFSPPPRHTASAMSPQRASNATKETVGMSGGYNNATSELVERVAAKAFSDDRAKATFRTLACVALARLQIEANDAGIRAIKDAFRNGSYDFAPALRFLEAAYPLRA